MVATDLALIKQRCARYRRRILEISQGVSALHVAPAFSCTEITDAIYNELMVERDGADLSDIFIMSKAHGSMIQYVILESIGVLSKADLDHYCKQGGRLGAHPDYETPGIAASTGSLGHGLGIAVGQAYAEQRKQSPVTFYVVLSDGELQEGSTWEALSMAANLGLKNIVAVVDNNDFTSLERISVGHPAFYPVVEKVAAFGWEATEVDGHDSREIIDAISSRSRTKPFLLNAKTTKGKGVSFMENMNIWHYRSPNAEEYKIALDDIERALS